MLRSSPRARLAGFDHLEDRLTPTAGVLDTTFSTDGKLTTDFTGTDAAHAVVVQPDGKIVAVGSTSNNNDFAIARYNPDGTLDATFGTGGKFTPTFGGVDVATAVALQPNGRIVVVGYTDQPGTNDFAVTRLMPNGTLDGSFAGDGTTTVSFSNDDRANAVAVAADGTIVVAGSRDGGSSNFAIARFEPDGDLDATFDGDGKAELTYGGAEFATGVAIQANGRVVVGGYSDDAGTNDFVVARFKTDGTPDATFGGGDGKVEIDFGGDDKANALTLQADGRIVVAGAGGVAPVDFALARLNTNGSLDVTFSADGKREITIGNVDVATGVAVQSNGQILVGGYSNDAGTNDFYVYRLNADGNTNSSFGTSGKAVIDFGGDDQLRGIALQPDGDIVAVGSTANNFAAVRVDAHDGAMVANFGNETYRWFDGSWQKLANAAAQELDIADDGTVWGVYANGTWRWAPGAAGVLTTPGIAQQVEVLDGGVAYGDFGGDGVYRHTEAGGWVQISAQNPTMIETSDDGSVFGYFVGGLYRWRTDTGWQLMTGNVPSSFTAADGGAFYGVFPNGVWRWQDGNWTGVTGAIPQTYGVSDTGLFYGDFGGGDGGPDGVWQWSPFTQVWTGVTGADPVHMSVAANGDLHGAFVGGPTGLWKWTAATGAWSQSHTSTPVAGGVGVDGSYFADFGPGVPGIWRFEEGAGWTLLSSAVPTMIKTRR